MKKIIAIIVTLFSVASFACPNFSGEYFNENFKTYYQIQQNGCESILYNYESGIEERILNGKEIFVDQFDIFVEEGRLLASVYIFETSEFQGDILVTKTRTRTIYARGDEEEEIVINKTSKLPNLDLQTEIIGKYGSEIIIDRYMSK